jgi:hypothetical protein
MKLLSAVTEWYCPNCGLTDQTRGPVQSRFHPCPKLRGLAAPLIRTGIKAKVTAHEREDYVGSALVHRDQSGRPVFLIQTTRDDGTDAVVFPDTATIGAAALGAKA